ncbi:MAG: hypothetical protein N4A49_15145 [Marinifilaceae bacterium]|nr:hypothetical protein [Marinifilaceae bacterium]
MKKKLKKISEGSAPDVRFKIILFSGKKITKLCYGHSSEVVIINGQKYEFNKDLNKFIIKIIEKKGYKRPQRAKPPL